MKHILILIIFLFPLFASAQILRAYGVIEVGSLPASSATGPKFAYRPADSSFYRWVSGSTWVKIIPDEPDTLYLKQLSGTTALVDGDTIDISTYFLKSDTTSAFASYLKRPVGWGLSLLTGKYPFVDSSKVASRYYVSTSPTTIANNYIATSNGSNLVARNLFDNNTYVGILNSKPFQLGQWTTAGRPGGVTGYMGYNTTLGYQEFYDGSTWYPTGFWAKSGTKLSWTSGEAQIGNTISSFPFSADWRLQIQGSGSGLSGRTGFIIKNSDATSAATFALLNSSNEYILTQISGSSFAVPSVAAISTNNLDLKFFTNGEIASGGSAKVILNPGGYSQTPILSAGGSSIAIAHTGTPVLDVHLKKTSSAAVVGFLSENAASNGFSRFEVKNNSGNTGSITKYGSTVSTYKITSANSTQIYNSSAGGDITLLNDYASGQILFSAGGSSSAHLTITSAGRLGLSKSAPDYIFDVTSANAFGFPRGTVAQRPTIVASTSPMRFNTDSTAFEYGESAGVWRLFSTKEYARSLINNGAANPTATIGLTTINGSSVKFLRSDAAPALSQAIRPTWTDRHRFGDTTWMDGNLDMAYTSAIRIGGISSDYSYGMRLESGGTMLHSSTYLYLGFSDGAGATSSKPYYFDNNNRFHIATTNTNTGSNTFMLNGRALIGYDVTTAIPSNSLAVGGTIGVGTLSAGQELDVNGDGYIWDSLRVGTRPNMASATDVAVYDANGWLGYRTVTSIQDGNGIYTGSATLANHTTRALIPSTGNLLFSQKYNSNADSAYIQVINNLDGNREVRVGLTDTITTGYTNFRVYQDEADEEMGWEILTSDGTGTTTVRGQGGNLSMYADGTYEMRGTEIRLNNGEVLMNQYGQDNMKASDLGQTSSNFLAGYSTTGRVVDFQIRRDTFTEDASVTITNTSLGDCSELFITTSMTNLAAAHLVVSLPSPSASNHNKRVVVWNRRKDVGLFVPVIDVTGGGSTLYYTANTATTAPSDQATLTLDGTTWHHFGKTYVFNCVKINSTDYRWVLTQ